MRVTSGPRRAGLLHILLVKNQGNEEIYPA
jgi:hypothetical protein